MTDRSPPLQDACRGFTGSTGGHPGPRRRMVSNLRTARLMSVLARVHACMCARVCYQASSALPLNFLTSYCPSHTRSPPPRPFLVTGQIMLSAHQLRALKSQDGLSEGHSASHIICFNREVIMCFTLSRKERGEKTLLICAPCGALSCLQIRRLLTQF